MPQISSLTSEGNWGLERLGDLVWCPFRWQRSTKSSIFLSPLNCQTGPFKPLGLPLFLPKWEEGGPKGLNDWKTPWTIFPNSLSHFNLWVWVKDKPILIQSQVLNVPFLLDLQDFREKQHHNLHWSSIDPKESYIQYLLSTLCITLGYIAVI